MDKIKINSDLTDREKLVATRTAEAVLVRLKPELRNLVVAATVAVVISIGGGIAGWVLTARQNDRIDRESRERVAALQASRVALTTSSCRDSNERNLRTKRRIDQLLSPASRPSPEALTQAAATKSLIDELSPFRRNCVAYARARVYGNTR